MRSKRRAGPAAAARFVITLALVVVPVSVMPSTMAHGVGAVGGVGTITTVAGGLGIGPALSMGIGPAGLLLRGSELIVADSANGVVRAVDLTTGGQRVIAGTNSTPRPGRDPLDGGPATSAFLNDPRGLAQDAAGNLYISEGASDRVRRIDPAGIITTVAGPGVYPTVGDGGPATAAFFRGTGLAVDSAGNFFIADAGQNRVRKVDTDGIITTVARVGATALAFDAAGDLLIADSPGRRILKLSGTTLSLVADIPVRVHSSNSLGGIAVGPGGVIYVTQPQSNRVMRVDPGGAVTTFAGDEAGPGEGPLDDGGPAVDANLATPDGVVADAAGNVYISDVYHYRVRRVDASGTITTVAGNGTKSFAGDGGPALDAEMSAASDIEVDPAGNIVLADPVNLLIRSVSPDGSIRTVAGNGAWSPVGGDGGPATAVGIGAYGVDTDRAGNVYVADGSGGRVRKVTPAGIISTVAGTRGSNGSTGDGGPATAATIVNPTDVAVDGMGNVFITDPESFRIRKVDPAGIITTFAGNGTRAYGGPGGDGGPATSAQLDVPGHLALDGAGNLFFTEVRYVETGRIRKVDAAGRISTFATNVAASDLAADHAGNLYVSDVVDQVIYRYDRNGVRTTIAGNGTPGFSGDGGPALAARISGPSGVAVAGDSLYISDGENNRIRRVSLAPARAVDWGLNHVGQLGDGTTASRSTATPATGALADVRSLSGGAYHSV
ncbi:MAG: trimeric autotransporter adhesin, partial [Actinomycetota bacterium]|nr:trimeric autotransporter adhesin [Actinomycetota bacterium]